MVKAGLPRGTPAAELLGRVGEDQVRRVLLAWAAPLRRTLDSLVATLDPEVVVLGGGLGAEATAALGLLPRAEPGWFTAPLRAAQLGDDAGVVGAAVAAFRRGAPKKRVVLVNGVPASGKSTVARMVADGLGWPLLTLDTVKQPFLDELPPGDRLWNRKLGRASYRAMLDLVRDAPEGSGFVLDAWFGFQPIDILEAGLGAAKIDAVAEIWCEAPPEEIGRRYGERVGRRGPGHPGLDYVPELIALAERAGPSGFAPVLRIDTARPIEASKALNWIRSKLRTDMLEDT
jgi:glucokinase